MRGEGTPIAVEGAPRYGRGEIAEALSALTRADRARIVAIARHFAGRSEMSWDDLSQEAYLRALGTRTCIVGTEMVAFLAGIMRSIVSEAPRARKRAREDAGLEVVYVADYEAKGLPQQAEGAPSPEASALSKVIQARQIEKVEAAIAHDEELQLLAMGYGDGMRGRALEEFMGVDAKGLAAAKKRLSRTLARAFVDGAGL